MQWIVGKLLASAERAQSMQRRPRAGTNCEHRVKNRHKKGRGRHTGMLPKQLQQLLWYSERH
jgi:hypothetical protein